MTNEELDAAIEVSPSKVRVTRELIESHVVNKSFVGPVGTLTICVLTMANGFNVTGESACIDPANYRQDIGEKIAYDNAFAKLWALEGYALASNGMPDNDVRPTDADFAAKLETAVTNEAAAYVTRMLDEREALSSKISALDSFVHSSPVFDGLEMIDQTLMVSQLYAMRCYDTVLSLRIGRAQDAGK